MGNEKKMRQNTPQKKKKKNEKMKMKMKMKSMREIILGLIG